MRKILRLELSAEKPVSDGSYYAELLLPAKDFEIRDAMQKLRAVGREDSVWISILECDGLCELENARLDSPTVDELNFFAKRLAAITDEERIVFDAVIRQVLPKNAEGELIRVKDLINSTYGLDGVPIVSNVSDLEELGRFAFENAMLDELAGISKEAVPYLDIEQIGRVQQKNDGGVFVGNDYVAAGEYMRPEIYDGRTLPEADETDSFVFRLKVGEYPTGGTKETEDDAEWIDLPMNAEAAKKLAKKHHEPYIDSCVCYALESSIPQITPEMYGGMLDFDKLNRLAWQIGVMSPLEQIKFKAALCAERPEDIAGALDIAKNLWRYEFYSTPEDSEPFFRIYLKHYLDPRFDGRWLDLLPSLDGSEELIKRLGASVTDYGVISARGRSLYELVPYQEQEVTEDESAQSGRDEEEETLGMKL